MRKGTQMKRNGNKEELRLSKTEDDKPDVRGADGYVGDEHLK